MVRITALMDNCLVGHKELIAEHGLSLYIEYRGKRLLFDCGPGPNMLRNAAHLGIDLRNLDAVILSHSHYDHAAGYRDLVEQGMGCNAVYTGTGFFAPKYALADGNCRDLSCGFDRDFLGKHGICHREVRDADQIFPGIWLVTAFPRENAFETIPLRYVRKTREGFAPDDFGDEVCIALETGCGITLMAGCSHPGIVNMVAHVRRVLGKPVHAVFGGTHLSAAEEGRIAVTVCRLKELGVRTLGLSHCSGGAVERMIAADPELQCCHLGSGDSWSDKL